MGQTLHMRSFRQHRGYQPARAVDGAAARAGRVRHASVPGSILPPHRQIAAVTEDEPSNVVSLYPEAGSSTGEVERPVRVMVVEGQTLIRAGYRALLEADELIEVVGEAATSELATACAVEARPDVVLLDLELPGLEAPDAAAELVSHPAFNGVAVLLMTLERCDERVLGALQAGAVGVLAKDAEPTELIRAVQVVARDQALLPVAVVRQLLGQLRATRRQQALPPGDLDELTAREREVLALVAGGLSNHEIADRLVISPATAKTHVSRAMLKLGANHRAQLAVLAYETGLVEPRSQAVGRFPNGG
jgi:DNA-binding NarL/FixJ family response regulator